MVVGSQDDACLQMDCRNFIRILHKVDDAKMYVCGTNAFDPQCDYMVRQSPLTHVRSGRGFCPVFIDLNVCSPTQMVS